MAIVPGLPGVQVTVRVDGRDATEYNDPDVAEPQQQGGGAGGASICTKFIECKDNTTFAVHLKVANQYAWGHRNHYLAMYVYLDGVWARSTVCRERDTLLGSWEGDVAYRDARTHSGQFVRQSFKFTEVTRVEGPHDKDRYQHDLETAKKMGIIEVRLCRVILGGLDNTTTPPLPSLTPANFELTERSLKGNALSHEALMQEGVIPRPATASPDQDLQRTTPTALRKFSRQQINSLALEMLQQKQDFKNNVAKDTAERTAIKQEHEQTAKRRFGEMDESAGEELARPYKMTKTADGKEIIDLVDDGDDE
ncbi:hypothetical protein AAE478_005571 [Parahypoxylon ruwenzoriense]